MNLIRSINKLNQSIQYHVKLTKLSQHQNERKSKGVIHILCHHKRGGGAFGDFWWQGGEGTSSSGVVTTNTKIKTQKLIYWPLV